MPVKTVKGNTTIKTQASHGASEVVLKAWHMGMPWMCWLLLTIFGNALYLGLRIGDHAALTWTGLGSLVIALAAAIFDGRLRAHRASWEGRWIGPLTCLLSGLALCLLLSLGYPVQLCLCYLFGGALACICWDSWIAHGDHRDMSATFNRKAAAAGLEGARMYETSRRPAGVTDDGDDPASSPRPTRRAGAGRGRASQVVEAGLVLPADPAMTPDEVGDRMGHAEVVTNAKPGSWALISPVDDAGVAGLRITDPDLLTAAPLAWPGPYAPGHDMSVPFRLALLQTGEPFLYRRLPISHLRVMGKTGSAKALKLDTPVPTPSGWATMGELADGDLVFDETGRPCRVLRAHPVLFGRPCYEVEFSDGSVITACEDHLWQVDSRASRNNIRRSAQPQVVTTAELAAGLRVNGGRHLEFSVRVAAPLQCPAADLPVPPYTLGAWLGDGTSMQGSITVADQEILSEVEADGFDVRLVPSTDRPGKTPRYLVEGLSRKLAQAGVRVPAAWHGLGHHTLRGDKHIPVTYLRAAENQRRALLAGLLDTDATCSKTGAVTFTNTNERLARDVLHLVSGLGYKASLTSKPARLYGKDCGMAWLVTFTPADKVFRLPRKASRQVTAVRATAGHRYVTAVRPVPSTPVRCLTVDSPSSLYLVSQACVPTHNTMGLAWNMLAEGITRLDYAAFVVDTAKREQFMGALRPALHQLITDEDAVHLFFARLHKARFDRMDYLGKMQHTEWFPGCGLSFMECWLEEAGEVLKLLGTTQADRREGRFMLVDHVGDVNTGRSAGMSWTESYQKAVKEQSQSTVTTSQMGRVCFALGDKADYPFGLSDLQRERGCRPTLWDNPRGKAMAFFDSETVPDDEKVTPMRFWNWGPGSGRIASYASEYQARDRPLDEVTGAALEWTPAVSPTSAFVPFGAPPAGSYDNRGPRSSMSPKKRSMVEAEAKTHETIEGWRRDGREFFAVEDLEKMGAYIGKTRTWYYGTLRKFATAWGIDEDTSAQKIRYRILPAVRPAPELDQDSDEEAS